MVRKSLFLDGKGFFLARLAHITPARRMLVRAIADGVIVRLDASYMEGEDHDDRKRAYACSAYRLQAP